MKIRDAKLQGLPYLLRWQPATERGVFMFKRPFAIILLIVCLLSAPTIALASTSNSYINLGELSDGIVIVSYQSPNDAKVKVKISKGNQQYVYSLTSNNRFPLQLGDGKYTISILENVTGTKYKMVENKDVILKASSKDKVYLQPIQMIYWNKDMKAIAKARELTKDLKQDKDKVTAIYNYIISNISYDYKKANNLPNEYIPSIDKTLEEKQGICYDYSALFAAMLRSEGIPTKLLMGSKNDIEQYHAWNEVYLQETNEWVTIDTTYDSIKSLGSKKPVMIKDKRDYSIEKQY